MTTKQLQCLKNSIRVLCQAATSKHGVNAVDAEALQALVQCTIPNLLLKVGSCGHHQPNVDVQVRCSLFLHCSR